MTVHLHLALLQFFLSYSISDQPSLSCFWHYCLVILSPRIIYLGIWICSQLLLAASLTLHTESCLLLPDSSCSPSRTNWTHRNPSCLTPCHNAESKRCFGLATCPNTLSAIAVQVWLQITGLRAGTTSPRSLPLGDLVLHSDVYTVADGLVYLASAPGPVWLSVPVGRDFASHPRCSRRCWPSEPHERNVRRTIVICNRPVKKRLFMSHVCTSSIPYLKKKVWLFKRKPTHGRPA